MRNIFLLSMSLMLVSCAQNTSVSDDSTMSAQAQIGKQEATVSLDLSKYAPLVKIRVPDRSQQGVDPTVIMDELSGYLTIKAGKNFQIILREEPTTLQDIRQELENEMMWQNSVTAVDNHSMIIERALPDGSMAQHHFASVLPGIGGNIVLRSNPMGEFSKKDVERMIHSAQTLETETGLAQSIN